MRQHPETHRLAAFPVHSPQSEEMRQAAALPPAVPGQPAVELRAASFTWSPGARPLLHTIDLAGE